MPQIKEKIVGNRVDSCRCFFDVCFTQNLYDKHVCQCLNVYLNLYMAQKFCIRLQHFYKMRADVSR